MNKFDKIYGLVGKKLGHSFSKDYFNKKFSELNLNHSYQNIEIDDISDIITFVKENKNLKGFNVTVPYKESIIPYLDELDATAKEVGAINTVKIHDDGRLQGFNTDVFGFRELLGKEVIDHVRTLKYKDVLIFGSGGASKAVQYVLRQEGIPYRVVTRHCKTRYDIGYFEMYDKGFYPYSLIINATPVGMFPDIEECLDLPYSTIESHNIFIDLIYNPEETLFLKNARLKGVPTFNGLTMLYEQAEESWRIWNSNS